MEVALQHAITYSTKGDVAVAVVAQTLLANERLIQESVRVLGGCVSGFEIQKIHVRVAYLSNASPLREVFAVGLFMTYQDQLIKEVPELIQKLTGHPIPQGTETLVTVLVLMVAIYVISETVTRLFPGKEVKQLKKEYDQKIAELSAMTHIDPAAIESAVKSRLSEGKQKSLFRRAYDLFLPAKLEPGTKMLADDRVVVSDSAIAEIPSDVEWAQRDTTNVYELNGVGIEIHRSDLDYSQSGWAAVIEEVSHKRRKMVLPPEIKPSDLYGKKQIVGDVSVVEQMQDDGVYEAKEYHLLRLHG